MNNTAKLTFATAKNLAAHMGAAGHSLSMRDAWTLTRIAERAAVIVADQQAAAEREQRVRRGMVANWCAEARACGSWDGE